jgi:hypothetical protein
VLDAVVAIRRHARSVSQLFPDGGVRLDLSPIGLADGVESLPPLHGSANI